MSVGNLSHNMVQLDGGSVWDNFLIDKSRLSSLIGLNQKHKDRQACRQAGRQAGRDNQTDRRRQRLLSWPTISPEIIPV